MDVLEKLVSLEEKRVSTPMVSMLVMLSFCLFMYWHRGDISSNLVNILGSLIAGVIGVSIANVADSALGKGTTMSTTATGLDGAVYYHF
ncbi:MAG: hypothetical protein CVU90_08850 [Firmicutes bacterium HGW-Firmicutes-15]|nr:MAG: hypothetical protein CVU90_08850 [Firmicutes bacterium HGW-Firmicutes-15]